LVRPDIIPPEELDPRLDEAEQEREERIEKQMEAIHAAEESMLDEMEGIEAERTFRRRSGGLVQKPKQRSKRTRKNGKGLARRN
jgi:hypothetical protein